MKTQHHRIFALTAAEIIPNLESGPARASKVRITRSWKQMPKAKIQHQSIRRKIFPNQLGRNSIIGCP